MQIILAAVLEHSVSFLKFTLAARLEGVPYLPRTLSPFNGALPVARNEISSMIVISYTHCPLQAANWFHENFKTTTWIHESECRLQKDMSVCSV